MGFYISLVFGIEIELRVDVVNCLIGYLLMILLITKEQQ